MKYFLPAKKNTLLQKRLKWCCLKCNGKFAKEYALMLHLAHFHYFELLIPMKSKRIEFAEKAYYSCTQKNCEATFKTSKALVTHEQLMHQAMQVYLGKMIGENDLFMKLD